MVFNNVGHNVLNIQTGSPYLLRNEAGGRHSRSGIDFEHIDFFSFCDDVIHAHDTLASQYVVDGRCQLLYAAGQFRSETSRCDFCYFAFVFGGIKM